MSDFEFWTLMSDFGFWTLMSEFGFWTPMSDFGFWTLVSDIWILDTSVRYLDFGYQCLILYLDTRVRFWVVESKSYSEWIRICSSISN